MDKHISQVTTFLSSHDQYFPRPLSFREDELNSQRAYVKRLLDEYDGGDSLTRYEHKVHIIRHISRLQLMEKERDDYYRKLAEFTKSSAFKILNDEADELLKIV